MNPFSQFRWPCLVLISFLLSACATRPIDPAVRARIKKVGVISLMNDRVESKVVGTTVFNNGQSETPTQQLGLHELGEWITAGTLPGLNTRILGSERARVASVARTSATQRFFSGDHLKPKVVMEEMRRLGKAYGLDAVIALVPYTIQAFDSNAYLTGYTIYRRSIFGSGQTTAYALQRFEVYDGPSGALLGSGGNLGMTPLLDDAWRSPEAPEVRAGFAQAIKTNAVKALSALGFNASEARVDAEARKTEVIDW